MESEKYALSTVFLTHTGGDYSHNIRDWKTFDRPANLSHCFVAINPGLFASGFEDRMSDLMGYCRSMEPVSANSVSSILAQDHFSLRSDCFVSQVRNWNSPPTRYPLPEAHKLLALSGEWWGWQSLWWNPCWGGKYKTKNHFCSRLILVSQCWWLGILNKPTASWWKLREASPTTRIRPRNVYVLSCDLLVIFHSIFWLNLKIHLHCIFCHPSAMLLFWNTE